MIKQDEEFAQLKKVIVCPPDHMAIREIINATQRHYENDNIDIQRAKEEHKKFVQALEENGVEVISLEPNEKFNEQVFTRDIGFTIGDTVFISYMEKDIRKKEVEVLTAYLDKNNLSYHRLNTPAIEGGDVVVSNDYVFVGVSTRTTMEAIEALQSQLCDRKVVPLPIRKDILHLDCVFNLVSEKEALIYSPAFNKEDVAWLSDKYDLIEVSDKEQFTLGTNVLSIGNKKIIALPINPKVNKDLTDRGYQIIEVPFSEIIKSGGSFRCCSMPIVRS
ncbi:hypothetical protein F9U64_15300 [Gracilibacillus oryzae]|uniref:N(G),N(G)-dimethylarginine dimethylaminohydrolase n=1 Tax=Gracilibacillus oryzae TaxID=1672701 RepID=A0A7C8KSR5_9BACI|nr:dimethylarginine dimethylaminohydrolase family protein [Gracilibacillus oryzae]KAB8129374.1 hypothetical protein F9U64_15300 [Gracilibacillus oryzae]